MATELNLTPTQALVLIALITVALIFLWLKKSYYQLDIEPRVDTVEDKTTDQLNDCFGAYIQAQGNYYN